MNSSSGYQGHSHDQHASHVEAQVSFFGGCVSCCDHLFLMPQAWSTHCRGDRLAEFQRGGTCQFVYTVVLYSSGKRIWCQALRAYPSTVGDCVPLPRRAGQLQIALVRWPISCPDQTYCCTTTYIIFAAWSWPDTRRVFPVFATKPGFQVDFIVGGNSLIRSMSTACRRL